jgi:hypothetical protein
MDAMGVHLCTCTTHSGVKKAHDWSVEQQSDLFRTTHKTNTQHVTKRRGRHCGDIVLVSYLANSEVEYTNNPPSVVSFMTVISSTSGRLHRNKQNKQQNNNGDDWS